MSLTKATNRMISGAVFNVLDYGAVGNGSTDDLSAIQSAIDAAETAGGGTVLLPYSDDGYLISGTIQIKEKVHLSGERPSQGWIGWADFLAAKGFIKLADNANVPMIEVGSGVDLWGIHNLKFNGNAANQTSYGAVGIRAVHPNFGWVISGCSFVNTKGYALLKLNRGVAEIYDNTFENGICLQRASDYKIVNNNIFSDDTAKTTVFPPFWIGDTAVKNIIEGNMIWHGPSDTDLLSKDISSVSGTTVNFGSAHGFFEKMPLTITTTGTLPEPLATGLADDPVTYTYIANIIDSTSIRLAKTVGEYDSGTWINFTTAGTGTHSLRHGIESTFFLQGASSIYNLICSNRIEDGEQHAAVVKGAAKNSFVNNYMGKSNRQNKANGSGLQLQSDANNNTFTGNFFGRSLLSGALSQDKFGVRIDSTCFENSFENNDAVNNLTLNISDLYTSSYSSKNLYGLREMNLDSTSIPFSAGRSQNVAFELRQNATISNITASSNYDVAFDTEVFDTASACSSGVFTAPVSGRYQFNFALQLSNIDTASAYVLAYIFTTDSSYRFYINANQMVADFDNQTIQGSAIASMTSGQTAKIRLFISGGANQVDIIGGGGTTDSSFFMGTLLD